MRNHNLRTKGAENEEPQPQNKSAKIYQPKRNYSPACVIAGLTSDPLRVCMGLRLGGRNDGELIGFCARFRVVTTHKLFRRLKNV